VEVWKQTMVDVRKQVVTGLIPPQVGEAKIRDAWPSVAATCAPAAHVGRKLMLSKCAAPLGWLILLPVYFWKILPFVARRYTLTNRRVMVQAGLKPVPRQEVALADIDDVRVIQDANSEFYRAATLEIIGKDGDVALTLPGVPGAEALRHAILNAAKAWTAPKPPAINAAEAPAPAAVAS
jgi:hypothetical protein